MKRYGEPFGSSEHITGVLLGSEKSNRCEARMWPGPLVIKVDKD